MAISDKKKVQTMLNITGQQALIIRNAINTIKNIRTTFNIHNPSVSGTPLDGQVSNLNTRVNAVDDEMNNGASGAVWQGLINSIVPTHNNNALR